MELELKGKGFAITGSTRGIGLGVARALAREGARVAISGRNPTTLNEAIEHLKRDGAERAFGVACDLLPPRGIEDFIDAAATALGRLDGVVASLGGTVGSTLAASSAEDWTATFAVNSVHAVRVVKSAMPHLERAGGGSAVIIASISGSRPSPRGQYSAAKAAQIATAASLARELAPLRIRVNTVSPGSILFEGGSWARRSKEIPERIADFLSREFPWKRFGTVEEVSSVVSFLLSPRASWVNGTDVIVDGAQGHPSIPL